MNQLSREKSPKRLIFQWTTLRGFTAILLFLIIATSIEYIVVFYTLNIPDSHINKDNTLLQQSLQLPGTDWIITISPLFHLVPIAVIIALVSSWTYLTKYIAVKPQKKWKGNVKSDAKRENKSGLKDVKKLASKMRYLTRRVKSGLLRIRGVVYLWQKIHYARATIKGAIIVLLAFGTLILLVSLLTYPQLIYWTVSDTYQNNTSLLGFIKSVSNSGRSITEALAPIGWVCTVVNNALMSIAPEFGDIVVNLGGLTKPLVALDDMGKYLIFQNVATWVSALTTLSYGAYRRKSYRHKKGRKH